MDTDLLILTDYRNERDFLIIQKYYKHKNPVYNLGVKNLGLSIENKNLPFLFILTKDLRVTKIFVPFNEIPYQTAEYITYAYNLLKN